MVCDGWERWPEVLLETATHQQRETQEAAATCPEAGRCSLEEPCEDDGEADVVEAVPRVKVEACVREEVPSAAAAAAAEEEGVLGFLIGLVVFPEFDFPGFDLPQDLPALLF
jgi:hypothetical protein